MARTSYSDMSGLPDPLLSYNFDLVIPNIPGGGNTKALTIKCQSTSLPGKSLEDVTVTAHGVELKYAGRVVYTHTQQATFYETRDLTTRDALRGWMESARDVPTNSGDYKVNYGTLAYLLLYDDTVTNVIRTIQFDGFFCQDMQEATLEGSGSSVVTISATFYYDLWKDL